MRVVIAGATGATGRHIVHRALEQGHEVTAISRRPDAFGPHPALRTVVAEVAGEKPLDAVIDGHDVVISALGSKLRGPERHLKISEQAHRNLVEAAERTGVARITTMFAYGSGATASHSPLFVKALAKTVLRHDFADLRKAGNELAGSGLGWTAVYFGALTDDAFSGCWELSRDLRRPARFRVSRADVADALLAVSQDSVWERSSVVLSGPVRS